MAKAVKMTTWPWTLLRSTDVSLGAKKRPEMRKRQKGKARRAKCREESNP